MPIWKRTATPRSARRRPGAPPTVDREYLFAHLLRTFESACINATRYNLAPLRIVVFLKKRNFDTTGCEAKLNRPSAHPETSHTDTRIFLAETC
ncbi:MAG: hypothetical protein ACYC5X_05925 [Syntrophales bacterium]